MENKDIQPNKLAPKNPKNKIYKIPGNICALTDPNLSTIFEPREKAYEKFLNTVKFMNYFLNVDLETYEKYNYKALGFKDNSHKKPKLVPQLRKDDSTEPNLRVSLYSQQEDPDFYVMRLFINKEYTFMKKILYDKATPEKRPLFGGSRVGFCNNTEEVKMNFAKVPTTNVNTKNKTFKASNGVSFEYQLKYIEKFNMYYVVVNINQKEDQATQEAKKELISQQTLLQMSKQTLI